MQAQLANQAARQAGSQQRLGAAAQLGSLANLGFGMGQTVQHQMAQQGAITAAVTAADYGCSSVSVWGLP